MEKVSLPRLTLPSAHTVQYMEGDEADRLRKYNLCFRKGIIKLYPDDWILNSHFLKIAERIYNFKVKPTDVHVSSFPKTGTTWTQEIVWTLRFNSDLNNPLASSPIERRVCDLAADLFIHINQDEEIINDYEKIYSGKFTDDDIVFQSADQVSGPRVMKNHYPIGILNPKILEISKVVYITRDPRDVVISYFHFVKSHALFEYQGTFDEYFDEFINDKIMFGPFWTHVKKAWDQRNHPNMCFLFYEDLIEDISSQIKKLDKFLGTNRTDKQIQNVIHHTSFCNMKERCKDSQPTSFGNRLFLNKYLSEGSGFFRKGMAGEWKTTLSSEQKNRINNWMEMNLRQFEDDFKYKNLSV